MTTKNRSITEASVCVVGGAGFLGSHLVNHLIEDRACPVLVVDNLISGRHEFVHKDADFEHHDITTSESYLARLFRKYGVDFVFNYAAEPYIPVSFERPIHVFMTNAVGALMVMNAAQEAECDGVLQVSSAEIYGEFYGDETVDKRFCNPQMKEDAPVRPHSTYGAAKAALDYMVQCRWREARTPAIALRQFNCIGERETHPYVVPEIISQLSKQWRGGNQWEHEVNCRIEEGPETPNTATVKLGNNSFRDFQYAGDAVRRAVLLLEYGKFGEVYNMGSEEGIKIYSLATLLGELMGFEAVSIRPDPKRMRPWEIWHLQSDNTKLDEVIGKQPTTPLETALARTIHYFNENGRKWCWEK